MTLQKLIDEAWEVLGEEVLEEGAVGEAAPQRLRRRVAGRGARKMSKKCPVGMHMQGGRCIRVPKGKLSQQKRKKKKWGRSGAAKRSRKRSARFARRFG